LPARKNPSKMNAMQMNFFIESRTPTYRIQILGVNWAGDKLLHAKTQ
jgi:hypothetical protein